MSDKIFTITLSCGGAKKKCEIESNYTLHHLCTFVLDCFEFENDHLHEFYLSKSGQPYSNSNIKIPDEATKLSDIFPRDDKHKLFMLFDFGDSWVFTINKSRKKTAHDKNVDYPCVIEEKGENPGQYPDYEDESEY
ncbi:IS1096 element passenger TnpR family protein [Piscirickettsia salmonis]|uniref:IS1096 element passenger TnpR family protein n=1 Tax=Piscirickettsia salmonis TaxID=1238 RepID=UPI0006BDF1BC|nr:hypothetical protein [Piscirickettsia salmonis]ALA26688.1 hypothetical protein KW89_3p62 [Piscirickettsia salmonis]APS45897.1 hypothetical protein AVI48_15825 [Piscirickettsia salmonis]APS49220.1 hypothetical protein AVI49_16300 [Piscirickettsia salmonis]QGO82303.1 Plasmid pRiA4b ORF-3-like protein [Piscirickettsia salmonis]QGP24132.1 Plasmid pRiA4b ORF-3-like protein [Piscirickettsia salmonis]